MGRQMAALIRGADKREGIKEIEGKQSAEYSGDRNVETKRAN